MLYTNSKPSLSNYFLRLKAALILLLLSSTIAFAELELNGQLAGNLSGNDSDVALELLPSLGIEYDSRNLRFTSELSTAFSSESTPLWTERWLSTNSLNWSTNSRILSGAFGFSRDQSEATAASVVNETSTAALNVLLPQSQIVNHQVNLSISEQVVTQNDDRLGRDLATGVSYSFSNRFQSNAQLQAGAGWQTDSSDTQVLSANLSWTRSGAKHSVIASAFTAQTLQDAQSSTNVGGQLTWLSSLQLAELSINLQRSQTDSFSFFEVEFFEEAIVQQSQIIVDRIDFQLSDIKVFENGQLETQFSVGRTQSATEIELIALANQLETTFREWTAAYTYQASPRSVFSVDFLYQQQGSESESEFGFNYAHSFSEHWSIDANLSQTLTPDQAFDWRLGLVFDL